jgi:hypothetical protein
MTCEILVLEVREVLIYEMNRTLVARHVELLEVARDRWRAFHGALGSKSG